MSTQTVVDVVISGSTTTVVDKRIDGVTTVAGAPPLTNVSGQVPDLGVDTDILATEGDILSLTNDVANLRANLIVTGTTLTDEIGVLSGHVISTGNNLEFQISTLSGNLIASGNNLDSLRDILSGNLAATGDDLKASVTGITGDIDTLTSNLISTGNNLQNQILNSGDILDDVSGNLITTGQTLTTNLISTGNLIQPQIDNIESNLITTGQTLLTTGSNLQALIVDNTNNLIDTGNNLEPRITANLASISSLQTETGLLSNATGELQEYKFNKSGGTISGVILPSSSGTLDLGSQSLPFRTGFFNDVKSANTLFIGDIPMSASNGGIDFSDTTGTTVFRDVSIRNLTVTGAEIIVDVENLAVKDNTILINSGESGAGIGVRSGGLVIDRGTLSDATILFEEDGGKFEFNFPVAVQGSNVITSSQTGVYATDSDIQNLQTQINSNDTNITSLELATGELKTQTNTTDTNLVTTGQFLTDEIAVVSGIAGGSTFDELSGDLITTGQTLTSEITVVSGLIGQEASDIDGLSGNLITTGQTLQTQITSNDSDIFTLTSNLRVTGSRTDSLSGSLIVTGQTLQTQISSNDSDINTLTSNLTQTGVVMMNLLIETGFAVDHISGNANTISGNLITTGQTLTDDIVIVSGIASQKTDVTELSGMVNTISGNLITTGSSVDILSGNLITTGQTLQAQITSNDNQIVGIIGDLVTTGTTLTNSINGIDRELADTGILIDEISGNLILTGKISDDISGNLITTGETLQTQITSNDGDIGALTSNLITTGQTLTSEIAIVSGLAGGGDIDTLSGNLITTGQTLQTQITSNDSDISAITSNLVTTGQTLSTDITTVSGLIVDNDGDITALKTATGVLKTNTDSNTANLITTGQTLHTQITSNDSDISTLTTNVGTTGQTLQTQITSNDSDITNLTSNLISTGQTLTTDITTVSGLITDNDDDITALKTATGVLKTSTDSNTDNLITTGQTLQTQITSNDGDIATLTNNLVTTGQTLQTQITSNDSDISTLTTNVGTTGQTLQTQITSNDSDITNLTSNLISTGQALTTDITTVSGLITDNDDDITALKTATGVLKTNTDSNTANLITTGQTLHTEIISNNSDISTLTTNLGTTGQTLQTQITDNDSDISTLSSNLVTTGQTLTTDITTVSGLITDNDDDITALKTATGVLKTSTDSNTDNLITTGQTLQTQITSNDGDIATLTNNLVTTGQTLQTQITSNDSDISTLTTNVGTTGQTLQTQITSNDSDITNLTSNLISTGQALTTDITTVSGLITDNDDDITALKSATGVLKTSTDTNTTNLITTGQTLQTQISSNDSDISTLTSNLVTTGQTLTTNINTVSSNLVSTGEVIDDVSGNLIITGQTLQTQITSNDGDITTLTSNLVTTGQTLTTNVNTVSTNLISTGAVVDEISGNLITTGQTLQTQITSNDGDITTLTSNLVTTGQTLTTNTNTVATNLGTSGQTLQTQITSNDSDITSLTTNLGTTGQTLQTQITSNDSDISTLDSTTVKLTTNQSIAGNKIFTDDVTINNLTVTGTEVVVDVENLAVKDNIIEINSGESSAGISRISGGIVIDRGTATNANILYNDATDRFELNFPLAVEGEVVASASNLITTGQTLQTQITSNDSDISTLTTNLGTTGQTLQTQITSNDSDINTLTSNLVSTGAVVDDISGDLITTGQTLQTQITSNDSDIATLTSNLVTTGRTLTTNINTVSTNLGTSGQTLQTQITSNDSDISTLSSNLITTGQTLQTQITSNDSDLSTLTSNLVTTGQTLTTNINTVSTNLVSTGTVVDDISGDLITTGQTLQTQITSNDSDISTLTSNLGTTGETLQTQITSNDSDITTLTSNLVTTGQTLTTDITTVSGLITDNDADITALKTATGVLKTNSDDNTANLISTGQTLQTQITNNDSDISTLTSNLITTGQTLTSEIGIVSGLTVTNLNNLISTGGVVDDVSGNLTTTGQTLQTQITSNDGDITTLTSNLVTTGQTLTTNINTVTTNLGTSGQTLQTQITSNDSDISTLTTNLGTTGQTLQTQITSNDSDISTLTSNLVTTGQTLTTNINTVSTNLGTSGQTLQTQITSNDTDITNLSSNLITTGQTLTTNINTVATNLVTTGQTLTSEIATVSGLIPATVIDGAGTANKVPLWSDGNTIGDSIMSQSNSKIGIGTNTPNSILEIVDASGPTIRLEDTTNTSRLDLRAEDSSVLIRSTSNFPMRFDVNQTERMRIATDGNVGIGTNAPSQKLHVNGSTLINNNNYHYGYTSGGAQAILIGIKSNNYLVVGQDNVNHSATNIFGGTGVIDFSTGGSTRATITSAGNVGIGTNSPDGNLHVFNASAGSITPHISANELVIEDGANAGISILCPSANSGTIYFGDESDNDVGRINYHHTGDRMDFIVGGDTSKAMYLGSNGLGVGIVASNAKLVVNNNSTSSPVNNIELMGSSITDGGGAGIFFKGSSNTTANRFGAQIQSIRNATGSGGATDLTFSNETASGGGMAEHVRIQYNGNVGIGTTDPVQKLEVFGNQRISNSGVLEFFGGTIYPQISRNTTSGGLIIDTAGGGVSNSVPLLSVRENGGTDFVTVLGSGNVGIGTVSPSAGLHVVNGGEPTAIIESTNAGSSGSRLQLYHNSASPADNDIISNIQITSKDSGGTKRYAALIQTIAADVNASSVDGDVRFLTYKSDTASEVLRITHDKYVGIGTNSPDGKLHVHAATAGTVTANSFGDDLVVENSSTVGMSLLCNNGGAGYIYFGDPTDNDIGQVVYDHNSNSLIFVTNAAERMRINTDGNVGIGTNAPSQKLHVAGNVRIDTDLRVSNDYSVNYFYKTDNSTMLGYLLMRDDGAGILSFPATQDIRIQHENTVRVAINTNGNVGINTSSHTHAWATTALTLKAIGTNKVAAFEVIGTGTGESALLFGNESILRASIVGKNGSHLTFNTNATNSGISQTERMRIQSGGNVGIGTNNPASKLHVYSGSSGATVDTASDDLIVENSNHGGISLLVPDNKASVITFGTASDAIGAKLQWDYTNNVFDMATAKAGGFIRFKVADQVEALRITADGNIGIGEDVPLAKLQIEGTDIILNTEGSNASKYFYMRSVGAGNTARIRTDGEMTFETGGGSVEQMRITNSGDVGIGTNSPNAILHISDATNDNLRIGTRGGNMNLLSVTDAGGGAPLAFEGTEFHFITGNVGIGTNSPITTLNLVNNNESTTQTNFTQALTNAGILITTEYTAGAYTPGIFWNTSDNDATKPKAGIYLKEASNGSNLYFGTSNSYATGITNDAMVINQNGCVGIGTVSPTCPLEIRQLDTDSSILVLRGLSQSNYNTQYPKVDFYSAYDTGDGYLTGRIYNGFITGGSQTDTQMRFAVPNSSGTLTDVMTLRNGNVGINTSSPNTHAWAHNAFTVKAVGTDKVLALEALGTGTGESALLFGNESILRASIVGKNGSHIAFNTNAGNSGTSQTERIRIQSDGNVGIGTNAASQKLHVNGLTKLGGQGKTEGGAVVNYATFGEIKGGAQTLLGNAVVPGTANNTIQHSKSDAGNYIRMVYSKGISFHTNVTGTINTDLDDDLYERMRINLDGNVGIGEDVPLAKLQIEGNDIILNTEGSNESKYFYMRYVGAGNTARIRTDGEMTFETGGGSTEQMRITNGGSVGIGTATVDSTFHVYSAATSMVRLQSASGNNDVGLDFYNGTDLKWQIRNNGNDHSFFIIPQSSTDSDAAFAITSDGNVGISTTSPDSKLEVVSGVDANTAIFRSTNNRASVKIQSSGTNKSSYLSFVNGGSQIAFIDGRYDDDYLRISTVKSTGFIAFETGSQVEKVRIKADGNVGIGTNAPSHKLHVYSTAESALVKFDGGDANNWIAINSDDGKSAGIKYENGGTGKWLVGHYNGAAGGFSFWDASTSDVELFIKEGGNIGMGLTTPVNALHVHGSGDGHGYIRITDASLGVSATHGARIGFNSGALRIQNYQNTSISFFVNNTTEALTIQNDGDVVVAGSFSADSKSFLIDHPTKENKKLEHGCLEGPEFGVYYRGRTQSNTIILPDYWAGLVREDSITIQLTPKGSFQHLYVISQCLSEVVIGAADGEIIDCFYTIYGERADIDSLVVEKDV